MTGLFYAGGFVFEEYESNEMIFTDVNKFFKQLSTKSGLVYQSYSFVSYIAYDSHIVQATFIQISASLTKFFFFDYHFIQFPNLVNL